MMKFKRRCVVLVAAVLFAGCDQPSVPAGSSAPAGTAAQPALPLPQVAAAPVEPVSSPPVDDPNQPAESPAAAPALGNASSTAPVASPAASASVPQIRLSTGVALAQTLPDGTGMLCSMDYQWISGGPQPGVEYDWVVEMGNRERMSGSAKVSKRSGTIEFALPRVRPERGPFTGAVFIKSATPGVAPQQISDFINLR